MSAVTHRATSTKVGSVLIFLLVALTVGCGPAHRYRPADTLAKGTVEVGAGIGAAARMENGEPGGAEVQAWVRGGAADRVELGGRFFTYSFSSFGGAFDFRAQLVRGPIDLSVDISALGGVCCGAGNKNNTLGAAVGIDAGFSIGKRFGGVRGPAFYLAPHFQYSWALPLAHDWPKQLFLPVGADIPLGRSPISIRPEFLAVALFHNNGEIRWRVGGGIGVALQGPSPKQLRERRAERKADRERRSDPESTPRRAEMLDWGAG